MRIVATSDLHGHLPLIDRCDLLIIAGDLFPKEQDRDIAAQENWYRQTFIPWTESLPCRHILITPGNHDYYLDHLHQIGALPTPDPKMRTIILCNQTIVIEGLKIYGTPNTLPTPRNYAFGQSEDELAKTFDLIPNQLDILITHAAPKGIGRIATVEDDLDIGCEQLTEALSTRTIRHVICGHIHDGSHRKTHHKGMSLYNVSLCNREKQPVYPTRKIIL